jgi:hypothetical protein
MHSDTDIMKHCCEYKALRTHLRNVGTDTVDVPFVWWRDDTREGGNGVRRCLGAQDLSSEEVRLPE